MTLILNTIIATQSRLDAALTRLVEALRRLGGPTTPRRSMNG